MKTTMKPHADTFIGTSGFTLKGDGGEDILIAAPNEEIFTTAGDTVIVQPGDRISLYDAAGVVRNSSLSPIPQTFTSDPSTTPFTTTGIIHFKGATMDTKFDFSDVGLHTFDAPNDGVQYLGTGSFQHTLPRDAITFDKSGEMHVDYGPTHYTLIGTPYRNDAMLDQGIASGHVLLNGGAGKFDYSF